MPKQLGSAPRLRRAQRDGPEPATTAVRSGVVPEASGTSGERRPEVMRRGGTSVLEVRMEVCRVVMRVRWRAGRSASGEEGVGLRGVEGEVEGQVVMGRVSWARWCGGRAVVRKVARSSVGVEGKGVYVGTGSWSSMFFFGGGGGGGGGQEDG